jgi:hypothetical protein
MTIKENEFCKKYPDFNGLLTEILCNGLNGQFIDEVTLKNWRKNWNDYDYISIVVSQAEEVLAMDPFPELLIANITNTWSFVETRKEWMYKLSHMLELRIKALELV